MRTLLVLRHAKSSWRHAGLEDHDRPLNQRGKHDAPQIGKLLRHQNLIPDLIISSTAKRARRTADACAFDGAVHLERSLYLASPGAIVDVVRGLGGDATRVLVVGHSPGLEELIKRLTGRAEHFPTAALAQIELALDRWNELQLSTRGSLINLWRPKELDAPPV